MKTWSKDPENLDFEAGSEDCEANRGDENTKHKVQDRVLPKGWTYGVEREGAVKTNFDVGVDEIVTYDGQKACCIEVFQAERYTTVELTQTMRCNGLTGKRVRIGVRLKCEDITDQGTFFLQIFGPHEATLALDDMSNRVLKGTQDWTLNEVVLDVPDNAVEMKFGGSVMGRGKLWFADLKLEQVSKKVSKTDNYSNGCRGIWWPAPINKDFADDEEPAYLHQSCGLGVTPKGWLCCADPATGYEVGADDSIKRHGKRLGCIKAIGTRDAADNGLLFQKFDGKVYRGKRVRASAFIKTSGITGVCGMALWVMDAHQRELFRQDTFILDSKKDHDWAKREIVVQVPEHAGVLLVSLELSGGGTVWMDDFDFQEVGSDVSLTQSKWKAAPKNLDFSQAY
jgi:hypothetical protein